MRNGQIVILNGAPRAGKSSIAALTQETFAGAWMNLGVDVALQATPPRYQPGIGLRPGEPDHPAAPLVPTLFAAWYESIGAHSRRGLNVVGDVGHHDPEILVDCARRLEGLPAFFVGVRCPIDVMGHGLGHASRGAAALAMRARRTRHRTQRSRCDSSR